MGEQACHHITGFPSSRPVSEEMGGVGGVTPRLGGLFQVSSPWPQAVTRRGRGYPNTATEPAL